jgi:FkbM family methyltransferase
MNELLKRAVRYSVPRPVRNWLRSPAKSAEWLWDSAKFSFGGTETLRLSPAIAISLHPHAFRHAYAAQITDPGQSAEFENFIRQCNDRMVLFDIGAHYGLFSLIAAACGARVIAVEPSPIAMRMIKRHISMNRATNGAMNGANAKIQVVQAAVSDGAGWLQMLSSGIFSEGYFRLVTGRPARELTQVRAMTVDDLTSEFGAPTHIKIDVEGHEAAAVRGARKTLTRDAPQLFLELHTELRSKDRGDPSLTLKELKSVGYEAWSLDGRRLADDEILKESIVRIVAAPKSA